MRTGGRAADLLTQTGLQPDISLGSFAGGPARNQATGTPSQSPETSGSKAFAMTPIIQKLENPSDAEIARVTNVLVTAFGDDDPFSRILVGGDMSLCPLQLGSNVRVTAIGGEIHVACLGPAVEDIVGVALWFPPGKVAYSTDEQRQISREFFDIIPADLAKWWYNSFIPTTRRLSEEAVGCEYFADSWHLHLFGVVPEQQRKGFGKALIERVEHLAAQEKKAIILETTTDLDVKIYSRLGFVVRNQIVLESALGPATLHLMTKEP